MPQRSRHKTLLTAGTLGGIAAVITAVAALWSAVKPDSPLPDQSTQPITPKDAPASQGNEPITPTGTPKKESDGQSQSQTPPPSEVKTTGSEGLTIDADKPSYVIGEYAVITGSIGKPGEGKTVRIDVYDPKGRPFTTSNMDTMTDFDGRYSTQVLLENLYGATMTGEYTAKATYDKQTAATKFNLSQAAS
jgi:hypothetical protein